MNAGKGGAPSNQLDHFILISSNAPPEIHDVFSQKNLKQALMDAYSRRLPAIARVRLEHNGAPQENLAQILATSPLTGKLGVVFHQPTMQKEAWEYTTPAAAIAFDARGPGKIITFHYDPRAITPWDLNDRGAEEPCVVRVNVREGFIPRSIKQEQMALRGTPLPVPKFEIFSMAELAAFIRRTGIVPFRVSLLVYTTKTRYLYDVDLVNNILVRDPRSGKLPITGRQTRSARLFHGLDRYVAKREIPPVPGKILEMLFESDNLHPMDVTSVLGISEELATASLHTLVDRSLAIYNRGDNTYSPLPRAFLTEAEAMIETREESSPTGAEPALAPTPEEVPEPEEEPAAEEVAETVPSAPVPMPLLAAPIAEPPSPPPPPPEPTPMKSVPEPELPAPPPPPIAPPSTPQVPDPEVAALPVQEETKPAGPTGAFPPVAPPVSAPENTAAREEVRRLLAMLESKPTCPACNREMDPTDEEILCPECRKEMANMAL
jgi:hypothetical protein